MTSFSQIDFKRVPRPSGKSTPKPAPGFRNRFLGLALWLVLSAPTLALGQSLSVGISYPSFNASFIAGTEVIIQASTTTPAGTTVTKVEFLVNGSKVGEDLTAPFTYTWAIPADQASYNQLSTVVTNSAGATATQGGAGYTRVDVYQPNHVSTRKYYVKEGAAASNNGLSEATPFSTIQRAADVVQPGDTVFVMAGTYRNTSANGDVATLRRTGTADRWIVFTNYQTDRPKLSFNGWQGFNVTAGAAYYRIQGFEVEGNNANVTLEQAKQQPGSCEGPNPRGAPPAIFNGNGISVNGRTGNVRPHHIVIANNVVHDCGGGGISAIQSDYITIEDNTSYNNSWYTVYGTSGISILNAWNYDNNTTTPRYIIRNNRTYGNHLYVLWNNGGLCKIYDGNGIILDNNKAPKNPIGNYTGQFLIENNLAYQNGGRGINLNYTDNVTVLNNTTYQNGASDGGPGIGVESEIIIMGSDKVRVYNNIFYGRPGERVNEINNSTDLSHNNNLTFEGTGTPYFSGNENKVGLDPQFVDAANGDFRLLQASPAVNAGSALPGQFAAGDLGGIPRPQGASVDMGAYELVGVPLIITGQPASGATVCEGTAVSAWVKVEGPGPVSYQWYKDGTALTGLASATNDTLTLTDVTPASQGSYTVVVNGFNTLTSTAFDLTVTPLPAAPEVSSLTVRQGTPNVRLTALNCNGTLHWNGVEGEASLPVSTATLGTFTYEVTCSVGSCVSPVTTATVTVVPALRVSHKDGDNQPGNSLIRPYLKLHNEGTSPVPYGEITVRYWLTAEDFSPLTNLSVYWAQVGTNRVRMHYVLLSQPRQGALGYVEYSFDAAAGNLAGGSHSGEIQTGVAKQNWTAFKETDDYSFAPNAAYTPTDRITIYHKGVLVGGTEPAAVASVTALKVYAANKNGSTTTNQIRTDLRLANEGNLPVDYSQVTIRYWFSAEGDQPLVHTIDYAALGKAQVKGNFVKVGRAGTDTYLEIRFEPGLGQLPPLSSTGSIEQRVHKTDWSAFNESNDHSYQPAGALAENKNITAYINGSLVYGREPGASGARLRAKAEPSALRVLILGNPIRNGVVSLAVSGIEGQPVQLRVTDRQGRLVSQHHTERAGALEQYNLPLSQPPSGVLLLEVRSGLQKQVIKLLQP